MVASVRGAITVDNNTKDEILSATEEMLTKLLEINSIKNEDMINIVFSATRDLTKAYPAVAARKLGFTDVPLFCTQEMYVEGSLKKCIRVMLTFNTDKRKNEIKAVYLKGAAKLRPDLTGQAK